MSGEHESVLATAAYTGGGRVRIISICTIKLKFILIHETFVARFLIKEPGILVVIFYLS